MKHISYLLAGATLLLFAPASSAAIKVVTERNSTDATAAFKFKEVPAPAKNDAATKAKFTLVDGRRDANGADLDKLHDGRVASEEDQPSECFFFGAGTDGGRIAVDLGSAIEIKQVNTYSWHGATRGPQVYALYASEGGGGAFNAQPKRGTDPETCGWKLLAKVDSRPKQGEAGGQYGVTITNPEGILGKYRHLLFDISRTEDTDAFGNTFYTEIDVIDKNGPAPESVETTVAQVKRETFKVENGKYKFTIDTTEAPDLTEWATKEVAPMAQEWYPKLVKMLPSEGYEAPKNFSIIFSKSYNGVAATGGTRITCAANWMRQNVKGESKGAIFHEIVHVVQQYGRGPRRANATRPPGWLTEGLTDYIRWFLYEPQTRGAEITRRNFARARYDGSYRITGNFLNWVCEQHGKDFYQKLNAAIREGRYNSEETWKELTGKTVQELGDAWKTALEQKLGPVAAAPADVKPNTLTDAEKAAGWLLLFNGQDLAGWRNFKRDTIRPGWQVKEGALVCADPKNAGDIITTQKFAAFELLLEYNITEAGNSGIMYHVTEEGAAAWATGPEVQLEDNQKASDPVRCGWLYALYQPPDDPKTGKPLDATKPVGEWNHVRLLIAPEKCEHAINGVKYFEYVLGSDDFKSRVAKSKFGKMPLFAKAGSGHIALQGDHGQVSFRNIKIRPIEAKP
jgi:hypothetical protein